LRRWADKHSQGAVHKDAFAAFGEVSSASIIKDKFSGESRGFGFVEMPNKEEADKAIAGLNGKDLKGRPLTVNPLREILRM